MTSSPSLRAHRRMATLLAAAILLGAAHAPMSRAENPTSTATVRVQNAWARATPPGAGVGAVYLTIEGGAQDDRLLSAATSVASMVQIHATTESGGMTRMRETPGVDVPAHGRVELAPQGMHLMLMGLARPLTPGLRFVVTLQFERAGAIDSEVRVLEADAAPAHRH